MDDLKVFALNDEKLTEQLKLVKRFSENILMEFGLKKCAQCICVEGKPTKTDNIKINLDATIQEIDNEATFKFLRVKEGHQICHKQMHKTITKEYLHGTRLIQKTYLSPRNKIKAINQLAIPVFHSSCGIINWPQSEINKLEIKTRKLLMIHKMFYKTIAS